MKIVKIRQGVFETNSSSTHSITICTKEQYEDFKNGKFLIDWGGKFVPKTEENSKKSEDEDDEDEQYDDELRDFDSYGEDYETFYKEYTTPSGEQIVAFGYYGHD